MKLSKGEKVFLCFNYIILGLIALVMLYPIVYVFSASVSSPWALETGQVLLWPKGIRFDSYLQVLGNSEIWAAYANSVFYTVVGTAFNLFFTISGAYPLSKKNFSGRPVITFFVVLSMWFSAGIIPTYLNIRDLGLYDTRMAILIAFACSAFNLILLRSYFESIPRSLEEAAHIDGAGDFKVLTHIYLPMSGAALATIGLFYAVSRWNGYFWAMVLLNDSSKIPLQVLLKTLIVESSSTDEFANFVTQETAVSNDTIIYTTIVVAMVPMLLVYPYIQKFFVKGVTLGAVKG